MKRYLPLVFLVLGGVCAHLSHRQIDRVRFEDEGSDRIFLPSADALKVASMGYHTVTADLLWVRAVLTFSEIFDTKRSQDIRWLDAMLDTTAHLDPTWRTVYFHGSSMLRVLGAIDDSDALLLQGIEALPEDPYFPFSLGMNAYLHREDREAAARYLAQAAELPGAPPWYASAAAGFLEEGGGREGAIRYLREQLESTSEPAVQRALTRKLNDLIHDELVDKIQAHREVFIGKFGRDIRAIEELGELPPDPLGGAWILAPDGVIRSNLAEEKLATDAVSRERWMLTVDWATLD